jgi:cellulose synthase/poly-beta-1,6-N-acetylglucosamine synthase-like glycosyltransferase
MDWYYYIALAAILSQLLFLLQTYNNYRYAQAKYQKKRLWQELKVVLIVPCKGLDVDFQKNITSFFNQDYKNYLLWFVVEDDQDPAYVELKKLKNQLSQNSKTLDVQIFIAGKTQSCSQKIHNLLYCYERIGDDIGVLAFADSDVCVRSDWLSHLVYPLRQPKNGAATGYRWFIAKKNNLATLALSAVNAKVAQLLGNTRFNQAWGGSMAIRVKIFRRLGISEIWSKALSDDLSLSTTVKKAGLKVAFVPACLVATHESTTWGKLFEFSRRQFIITRIYAPKTWWFGLISSIYSVLGIWGAAGLAIYAAKINHPNLDLFISVPIVFLVNQFGRAILRQRTAEKLLENERQAMRAACLADILACWLWSLLLLFYIISSAFGRTIVWRNIRYKLLGPTEIIVEGNEKS